MSTQLDNTATIPSNLTADETSDGWRVVDADGGVWWPGAEAAEEIEASADPAATAARIADQQPTRGRWAQ